MKVNINQIKPGMKLAEDVFLPNGSILLNSDALLTEDIIATLNKYGIESVSIYADSASHETSGGSAAEQENISKSSADEIEDSVKNHSLNKPDIIITISNDEMKADMTVKPSEAEVQDLNYEDIITALAHEGIVTGINKKIIDDAIQAWKKEKKEYTYADIAFGRDSQPGHEGKISFDTSFITTLEDLEKIKKANYAWELKEEGIPLSEVNTGDVIAHKEPPIKPQPGKTVKGKELTTDEMIKTDIKHDDTIKMNEEDGTYIADKTGVVYNIENESGIIPLNFDGSVDIETSQDKMEAELIIHPALDNGKKATPDMVKEILREKNIVYGLKEELINKIITDLENGIEPDKPVIIAEGLPAQNGEDGKVDILFKTDTTLKPKQNEDGSVDFKNINLVHSVRANETLAKLIPPGEGKSGKNVEGKEIPCVSGAPAKLPTGKNTEVPEKDPSLLIAKVSGNVKYDGNIIEIHEGYIVEGDVDYSSGNIDYAKSVSVNGDIKAGFSVKCGGELEVNGVIEDATVEVGESLLCKQGFVGQGKGIVKTGGDANFGFIKNQTVLCNGNVSIAKEAMSCKILCRGSIIINGKPTSAAGGTFTARNSITLNKVGNQSGIKTVLEVGTDFTMINELKKTEQTMTEMSENIKKLQKTGEKYGQLLKIKKKLPEKEEFIYKKLKNALLKYAQEMKSLEIRREKITEKMHDFENAFIKLTSSAMPGTIFKFGDRQHLVKKEVIGPKSVRLIKQEIKII